MNYSPIRTQSPIISRPPTNPFARRRLAPLTLVATALLCTALADSLVTRPAFATPTFTTLVTFDSTTGIPMGNIALDQSGNIFGTTWSVPGNTEAIFEVPAPNHSALNLLATFSGSLGYEPQGIVVAPSGNIYGSSLIATGGSGGTVFVVPGPSHTSVTKLATFTFPGGSAPNGPPLLDSAGNLYGTTSLGGTNSKGTVYQVSNTGVLSYLHNFSGPDGSAPKAPLIADAAGNLYGTTSTGGANGKGSVFELSGPNHQTFTTLYSFNVTDGQEPDAALTLVNGNLFGTTRIGGAHGVGTVFKLSGPTLQTLTTLVSFNTPSGSIPFSGVIADSLGNLFGTTASGGAHAEGTIYELSGPNLQTFTSLYSFTGGADGSQPQTGLIADAAGNLYGLTPGNGAPGPSSVFELSGTGFSVPEPTSLSLLALGALTLLRTRRRPSALF